MCHELFSASSDGFYYLFCTPLQNTLLCYLLHSPCHRLDIIMVHVPYHSIFICFWAFLCFFMCFVSYDFDWWPSSYHQILPSLLLHEVLAFFTLCTSTLSAQNGIWWLVTLLVSLTVVSCLIISILPCHSCLFCCKHIHWCWILTSPCIPVPFHSVP